MKYINFIAFLFIFFLSNSYMIKASEKQPSFGDLSLKIAKICMAGDILCGLDNSIMRTGFCAFFAIPFALELDRNKAGICTTAVSLAICSNYMHNLHQHFESRKNQRRNN